MFGAMHFVYYINRLTDAMNKSNFITEKIVWCPHDT